MRDFRRFIKGIKFKDNNDGPNAIGDLSASLTADDNGAVYNYQNRIKAYLDGSEREILTNDQVQTLLNKTIDTDNNTILNIDTTNLRAGVLVTDVSTATSDTEIPSALAVKNAVDAQNEASEITYDNSTSGLTATNTQAAIDEIDGRVDTVETDLNTAESDLTAHTSATSGVHGVTGNVVGTSDTQTLTNKTIDGATITSPNQLDVKKDTEANLTTYASTATEGQIVYATDTQKLYQIIGNALAEIGVTDAIDITYDNSTSGLTATNTQAAIDEVEGRVDTVETDLTAHTSATSGVHGLTGDVVGTTDSQTITNKNIESSDINLGTASNSSKLVLSSDTKTNLDTLTREEASLYYGTDTDKLYVDNGTDLLEVGGGAGLENFISNPDFNLNANDWSAYADATSNTPVDGTGGTAAVTITRSTTNPLEGDGMGVITKDAVNRQGQGVSTDFTIPRAAQGKINRITFSYVTSANYNDNDIRIYVYDVTNSRIIDVIGRDLKASNFGSYLGEFQASSDSTSYRLIFHVASTNASAYTVDIDEVSVGRRSIAKGAIVIDWQEFTPTGTWTSNTSYVGYYRRNGDSLDMTVEITLSGTPNSTTLEVDLPPGLAIDSNKIEGSQPVGTVTLNGAGASDYIGIAATNSGNTAIRPTYVVNDAGTRVRSLGFTETTPITYSSGDFISIEVKGLPIDGWSGSGMISVDEGGRKIIARGQGNGGTSITANTTAIDFIETKDTSGAWDGTTFTAPSTGEYSITGGVLFSSSLTNPRIDYVINGSTQRAIGIQIGSADYIPFSGTASLKKGDTVIFRCTGSGTLSNNSIFHNLHIQKLATPQTMYSDHIDEVITANLVSDTAEQFTNGTYASGLTIDLTPGEWEIEYLVNSLCRISGGSTNVINNTVTILRNNTAGVYLPDTYVADTKHIFNSSNSITNTVSLKKRTNLVLTTNTTLELYFRKGEGGGGGASSSRLRGQISDFGTTVDTTYIRAKKIKSDV